MTTVQSALAAGGDDQQKAAPLGLFVLLLMGVACYFLFKSMSRHLKRVREDFPAGSTGARPGSTAVPAPTSATGPGASRPVPTRAVVTGLAPRDAARSDDLGIALDRERDAARAADDSVPPQPQ